MSIEKIDILNTNNVDNSDVHNDNSGNDNTWCLIYNAFRRCMNVLCCLNKGRYRTIRKNRDLGKNSNSDEENSDTNCRSVLYSDNHFQSLDVVSTTPQESVTDHSIVSKKNASKNSRENLDGENNENTCHESQVLHESICSIVSQSAEIPVRDRTILSEIVDNENASKSPDVLIKLLNFDEVGIDCSLGNDICYDKIFGAHQIISTLIKENLSDSVIRGKLYVQLLTLSKHSKHKTATLFLLKYNFVHIAKTVLKASDEPWMINIIIEIIADVCSNDKAIDIIGCDEELVFIILNNFKYCNDMLIPGKVLDLLLPITYKIQRDLQSPWAIHLINYQLLAANILEMLNNITNDHLSTAEDLLRFITKIGSFHSNFLQQVFKLNELFSALLTFFIHVIPEKERECTYSSEELWIIKCWLILMNTIKQCTLFKTYNGETFLLYMEIMYRILKPYNESHILASTKLKTKLKNPPKSPHDVNLLGNIQFVCDIPRSIQNMSILHNSLSLLTNFTCGDNIPYYVESILVNIIYYLKTTVPEFEIEKSLEKEVKGLLEQLIQYWIRIVENYDSEHIYNIMSLCKPTIREYLLALICDTDTPPELHRKAEEVAIRYYEK